MAPTNVIYQYSKMENDTWTNPIDLCFICAIKFAMTSDPLVEKIEIATPDYDLNNCKVCAKFIGDKIDI